MESQSMKLPLELIFGVMTSLLPPNPAKLIPVTDEAAQLLLRFTLVNRATHEHAVRRLQQRCIVLDDEPRLGAFLRCLELSRESVVAIPSVFHNIHSMYLSPFGSKMDNLPIAQWVRDLFGYTSPTLKRLIVDIPFDSLPPWADHLNVGPALHEGFARLSNLEEFVCTRDAARLGIPEIDESLALAGGNTAANDRKFKSILYKWPKLRRLGINRSMCNIRFWECIANLSSLEHIVLTSALAMRLMESGSETVYRETVKARLQQHASPLRVVFADVRDHQRESLSTAAVNGHGDAELEADGMKLTAYLIPIPKPKHFLDSNSEWLMSAALAGELWDVVGEPVTTVPEVMVSIDRPAQDGMPTAVDLP